MKRKRFSALLVVMKSCSLRRTPLISEFLPAGSTPGVAPLSLETETSQRELEQKLAELSATSTGTEHLQSDVPGCTPSRLDTAAVQRLRRGLELLRGTLHRNTFQYLLDGVELLEREQQAAVNQYRVSKDVQTDISLGSDNVPLASFGSAAPQGLGPLYRSTDPLPDTRVPAEAVYFRRKVSDEDVVSGSPPSPVHVMSPVKSPMKIRSRFSMRFAASEAIVRLANETPESRERNLKPGMQTIEEGTDSIEPVSESAASEALSEVREEGVPSPLRSGTRREPRDEEMSFQSSFLVGSEHAA